MQLLGRPRYERLPCNTYSTHVVASTTAAVCRRSVMPMTFNGIKAIVTTIRTRIAPSPTGDPHVGTAYVALFNFCFAKQAGGKFILRIEDTDRSRTRPGSEDAIITALRWLGLVWDEGPLVGGPHGPYRQSERGDIYRQHAAQLVEGGHAFPCFCTPGESTDRYDGGVGYSGRCASLHPNEVSRRLAGGEPSVIRLRVPREGSITIRDVVRGDIQFVWNSVDMQVLMKRDGMPTYHLANVVDDHLMGITHVIRGEEWISSAPKHVLLYHAFGWPLPVFCHLPLLRNPDRSKLSKRRNPTGILYYRNMGYLSEALRNYLGSLAWSHPRGEEKFSLDEMVKEFSLERISLGAPIFDTAKLDWLNGRWIREDLTVDEFMARVTEWRLNEAFLKPVARLAQPRIERMSDLEPLAGFLFRATVPLDSNAFARVKLPPEDVALALDTFATLVDRIEWKVEHIDQAFRTLAETFGVKLRNLLPPFYLALTGSVVSLPLYDSMVLLGRDIVRARLRDALRVFGVPSPEMMARREAILAGIDATRGQ